MNQIDRLLTGSGELDESLRRHFRRTADPTTTDERLGAIVASTATMRPRPAWLATLRRRAMPSPDLRGLVSRRVAWPLAALVVVTVAAAALIAGGRPSVVLESTEGPYEAIFVTGTGGAEDVPSALEVVAVRADGRERTIARIPRSSLPGQPDIASEPGEPTVVGPHVSTDGWLAFRVDGTADRWWAIVDLRSPQRPVRVVGIPWWGPFPSHASGAWGPTGRFVGSASEYHDLYYAIDVASGRVTEVEPIGVAEGDGPRYLRPDGTQLEICRLGGRDCEYADPHDGATVTVRDPDGGLTVRYRDDLLPDRAIDASFSADGSSIWLLLERGSRKSQPLLGRVDEADSAEVVRAIVDEPIAWSRSGSASIAGMAPDDSFMVVSVPRDADQRSLIVPTDVGGPPATIHRGTYAGSLWTSVADALADEPYRAPSVDDPRPPEGQQVPQPTASWGPA